MHAVVYLPLIIMENHQKWKRFFSVDKINKLLTIHVKYHIVVVKCGGFCLLMRGRPPFRRIREVIILCINTSSSDC